MTITRKTLKLKNPLLFHDDIFYFNVQRIIVEKTIQKFLSLCKTYPTFLLDHKWTGTTIKIISCLYAWLILFFFFQYKRVGDFLFWVIYHVCLIWLAPSPIHSFLDIRWDQLFNFLLNCKIFPNLLNILDLLNDVS